MHLALHLLGRHSTTWATLTALFALVIFEMGSCRVPRPAWTSILLFLLSCVAGMAAEYHRAQLLVEMGSHELFAWFGFWLPASWSPPWS
jgi:hypothetical protein